MEDFLSTVDWSRAQFALTAIYHWLFVPLTLGLSFMIAFMETKYLRTKDEQWLVMTKFWMKLFGVNFAIGVATGLILEFEFGTNWSNYSYFVGDIFGAPLAIEGILAFFMESTFIAIMFFGWKRVSPKVHLMATWLTAVGASLSALWILVANAWMQNPVGMEFNLDTARNEMVDFWAILFSPVAMNKFFHTVTSAFVLASVFVVSISAWYMLKKREPILSIRSMRLAAIFGLLSSIVVIWTGDGAARQVARVQPMKLAAMEDLIHGSTRAPLSIVPGVEVPGLLSLMAHHDMDAYVPGIYDLVYGASEKGYYSADQMIQRGRMVIHYFAQYKDAVAKGDTVVAAEIGALFKNPDFKEEFFRYMGYGYLDNPQQTVPPIELTYWSFRVMVGLGLWFIVVFVLALIFTRRGKVEVKRFWLHAFLWSLPMAYIASQAGWIVAEVGRQPWTIQNMLPTVAAVSRVDSGSVQITFWLFATLFTVLLVAEIMIMVKQIKKGPSAQ